MKIRQDRKEVSQDQRRAQQLFVTGRTEKDLRRESIPAPGSSSLRCATAGVGRGLVTELRVQRTDSRRGLLLAVRRQLKRLECGTAATRGVCQRSPGPTIEAKLHHLEHLKGGVTPPLQSLLCELAPASTSLTLDVGWLLSPALQRARRSRRVPDCAGAEQPRGATPCPRSEGAADRRYPASEVRGGDERSYPASEVRGSRREALPHALMPEAKGCGREEQPHARGHGRWPED